MIGVAVKYIKRGFNARACTLLHAQADGYPNQLPRHLSEPVPNAFHGVLELFPVLVEVGEGLKHAAVHDVDHAARVNVAPMQHGGVLPMKLAGGEVAPNNCEGAKHVFWGWVVGVGGDGRLHGS